MAMPSNHTGQPIDFLLSAVQEAPVAKRPQQGPLCEGIERMPGQKSLPLANKRLKAQRTQDMKMGSVEHHRAAADGYFDFKG